MPLRKSIINQPLAGARESSAGDDFHILWAARRALDLLDPKPTLSALAIEGPHPEEATRLDPSGDRLLAIDLSEYYGGKSFNDAVRIEFCQLKYSTRNPERPWTSARLSSGKCGGSAKSVIAKFAQAYRSYKEKYGADSVAEKLRLRVISNQPVSKSLKNAMNRVTELLEQPRPPRQLAALLRQLDTRQKKDIERLKAASGLGVRDFIALLSIVDLDSCGEASRDFHGTQLLMTLESLGVSESQGGGLSKLKSAIHQRMMPEQRTALPLDRDSLLPVFGISGYQKLFPCSPELRRDINLIDRPHSRQLAENVVCATRPILMHAVGGVGKTTTICDIEGHLPPGSIHIVYDCYGNGEYLNTGDARHTPHRALVQLANELAQCAGTPFLLPSYSTPVDDLVRDLCERLRTAVTALRTAICDAIILISIDAADNSIHAAKERNQRSFILDLLHHRMPDGVKMLVTCRTENLHLFASQAQLDQFELPAFELEETASHLRLYLEGASDEQCLEFHGSTDNGVPRVQKYLLDREVSSFDALLEPVRPAGKSLDELFDVWLEEAYRRSGATSTLDRLLAILITLRRPVPLRVIAKVAQDSEAIVRSFCGDAGRGLIVKGDEVGFRDQDFEDYLQRRAGATTPTISVEVATRLLEIRSCEPYAARHVHIYLERAGKSLELHELVLTEGKDIEGLDPVEATPVFLARVISAIRTTDPGSQQVAIFRLLFLAAEAKKRDLAVRNLIIENAELALRYSDPENLRTFCEQLEVDNEWPAPGHWQKARIFSLRPETHDKAEKHLREAGGWVRWWSTQPESEGRHTSARHAIRNADLANATEAILRIAGLQEAYGWMSSWRPKGLFANTIPMIVGSIADHEGVEYVLKLLGQRRWRADLSLYINSALRERGASLPTNILRHHGDVWRRFISKNEVPMSLRRHVLGLCEQLAGAGFRGAQTAADLLAAITPEVPRYPRICRYDRGPEWEAHLRWLTLREALSGEEIDLSKWLPAVPKPLASDAAAEQRSERRRSEDDRKELEQLYVILLRPFRIRARALVRRSLGEDRVELVRAIEPPFCSYEESHRRDGNEVRELLLRVAAQLVAHIDDQPVETAKGIVELLRKSASGWAIPNLLLLADRFSSVPLLAEITMELLEEAGAILMMPMCSGTEKVEYLLQMAAISRRFHEAVAREYFSKALEAAEEVDQEAPYQLRTLAGIGILAKSRLGEEASEACHTIARFTEQSYVALGYPSHWPWEDVFECVASMDPHSLPALLTRWDDRGFCNLDRRLASALAVLVGQGFWRPSDALCLSVIAYPAYHLRAILEKMLISERDRLYSILRMLERDVLVVVSPDARMDVGRAVCEWAESSGLREQSSVVRIREYLAFWDSIAKSSTPTETLHRGFEEEKDAIRELLRTCPLPSGPLTTEVLDGILTRISSLEHPGYYWVSEQLYCLAERIALRYRTSFLDALARHRGRTSTPGIDAINVLEDCKDRWSRDRSVIAWFMSVENAKQLVPRHCFQYFNRQRWNQVLDLFHVSPQQGLEMALPTLAERLQFNSAEQVYELIEGFSEALASGNAAEVMRHELRRLRTRLHPDSGDGPWNLQQRVPQDPDETLAMFIWKVLGHPDKRVRWRGAHAVRRLVRLNRTEILDRLIAGWDMKEVPAFCDRQHQFFWLSARTWLLMTLDRVAGESPDVLKPHSKFLFEQAVGCDPPHALQRHYAKQACLKLEDSDQGLFNGHEKQRLQSVNTSPFEGLHPRVESVVDESDVARVHYDFDFDPIDTIPYWFSDLAELFPVSMREIETRAARWICERWGFTREDVQSYTTPHGRNEDWLLALHRHGDEPTIEHLDRYLDWHSMMCVATELLDAKPLAEGRWEGDEVDFFKRFLGRWAPHFPHLWLADLLQAAPEEPLLFSLPNVPSEGWDREIPWTHYDGYLLTSRTSLPDLLPVSGSIEVSNYWCGESAEITSALVGRERAHSLMHALQTCENPWIYALPMRGGRKHDVAHESYWLSGWLSQSQEDDGRTDYKDTLRRSLEMQLPVFGEDFLEFSGASQSDDFAEFRDKRGILVGMMQIWDDSLLGRPSEQYFRGKRLFVRTATLFEYLGSRGCCLILECCISRTQKKESRDYVPRKAKIYLFHPDGRVEYLPKDSLPGEADRGGLGDEG